MINRLIGKDKIEYPIDQTVRIKDTDVRVFDPPFPGATTGITLTIHINNETGMEPEQIIREIKRSGLNGNHPFYKVMYLKSDRPTHYHVL